MIAASNSQHVRHKLCCDWRPRLVFLVHTGIREAWDDGCDATGGGGLARRDKDEEFHDIIIDVATPGLDDKYIFVSDRFRYFDVGLAIGELFDCTRDKGHVEPRIWEQITSLWTVSMAATHGEAAHRSATACASSG